MQIESFHICTAQTLKGLCFRGPLATADQLMGVQWTLALRRCILTATATAATAAPLLAHALVDT